MGEPVSPRLELRLAAAADVGGIRSIDARVYPQPWSSATVAHQIGRPDRVHVVVTSDGAVVGHAGLLFQADEGHVTTIAVDPSAQGGGIGRVLLLALLRSAIVAGLRAVTLEVRAHNTAALALYRRFGLAPAGIRRHYYADNGDDALVLWSPDLTGEYLERIARMEWPDGVHLGAELRRVDERAHAPTGSMPIPAPEPATTTEPIIEEIPT